MFSVANQCVMSRNEIHYLIFEQTRENASRGVRPKSELNRCEHKQDSRPKQLTNELAQIEWQQVRVHVIRKWIEQLVCMFCFASWMHSRSRGDTQTRLPPDGYFKDRSQKQHDVDPSPAHFHSFMLWSGRCQPWGRQSGWPSWGWCIFTYTGISVHTRNVCSHVLYYVSEVNPCLHP